MENEVIKQKISSDLTTNTVNIRSILNDTSELTIKYAKAAGCDICVIVCDSMIDLNTVSNLIYRPLLTLSRETLTPDELMKKLQSDILIAIDLNLPQTYEELIKRFMSGFTLILADGVDYAIAIGAQGFKTRAVEKSSSHNNLRSSGESFTEVIRTNISLVRRRLKSPDFICKMHTIGELSNTDAAICYLKNKASPDTVKKVEEKLKTIPLHMILEGGYIETFLQEDSNTLFTQIGVTDRPDKLAAKLYDGRIAVLVDGTPFAMYLPTLFSENFQTMDDYSGLPVYATFIRWLKYIAFIFTVALPGYYVAVANFNPEFLPPAVLFNVVAAEQTLPFSIFTECIVIHIIFEIMREAGLRLPSAIGHTVNIVGGLVLGDIVIKVGLVSAPLVLIVAIGAISSFIVPDLYPAITVTRFAFIIAGGVFGLYGLSVLTFLIMIKVCSMSCYGVPYTAPLTPFTMKAVRDWAIRISWRKMAESDLNLNELTGVEK